MKRKGRVWTDEQRQAAADRMRKTMAEKKEKESAVAVEERPIETGSELKEVQPTRREMAPEVQAVIDTMDPARKAKLEGIQARNLAMLAQTKEGQEAIARMNARHAPTVTEMAKAIDPASKQIVSSEEMNKSFGKEIVTPTFTDFAPPKPIVHEIPMKGPFRITGSQSGQCISEMGPCQCGEPKLKWHAICLKVKV